VPVSEMTCYCSVYMCDETILCFLVIAQLSSFLPLHRSQAYCLFIADYRAKNIYYMLVEI